MKIDAHHHFWRYDPVEYEWISDEMSAIRRNFLPAELEREITEVAVDGVISVQARQTLEETRWLLDLATRNSFILGVVGWAPLISPNAHAVLEELSAHPALRGVRHVLQGESNDYMLRDDFNRGIGLLRGLGLRYDILIYSHQLPYATQLVDRHPNQIFVLDHIAKPAIRSGEITQWRKDIRRLAARENVYCKLSGMVTEADWRLWGISQFRPYADVLLDAFGPRRLMFGSDWPVCLVACGYARWNRTVEELTAALSPHERARIFGQTAVDAYALD